MDERLQGLTQFNELIRNQFEYGGKKYALSDSRESTDMLFEVHGKNWLFGTMDKYTYRFKNLARERDLLKIACYCYILWLKRGFFLKSSGLIDVMDTTVAVKSEYFPKFTSDIIITSEDLLSRISPMTKQSMFNWLVGIEDKGEYISSRLKNWSKEAWEKIDRQSVLVLYVVVYILWKEKYLNVERHDEDVHETEKTITA